MQCGVFDDDDREHFSGSQAPLGPGASICQSSCVVCIGYAQQPAGISALGSVDLWYVAVCLISPPREQMDSYGA